MVASAACPDLFVVVLLIIKIRIKKGEVSTSICHWKKSIIYITPEYIYYKKRRGKALKSVNDLCQTHRCIVGFYIL